MNEAEKLTLTEKGRSLKQIIDRNRDQFGCVVQPPLTEGNTYTIHISESNNIFSEVDSSNPEACWQVVKNKLEEENKVAAVGGYGEKRTAYRVNPSLYGNDDEERCIHIGVDIWMEAGTPIHAPLDATVHSFADNASLGNYGPTIILEHELEGISFYTLHGHLTRESLKGIEVGQQISKGEVFAAIGAAEVNGNWPPHLHYQFIADMMGGKGDFIGVTTEAETDFYLSLCPEPVVF